MTDGTHPGEVPGVEGGGGRPVVRSDGGTGGGLFAAMPDPAVTYVVGPDDARVADVNPAYVRDFDVDPGVGDALETRLRTDLERDPPGEGVEGDDDIVELVEGAEEGNTTRTVVRANTPGGERDYLARVVPLADGDDDGYLVLTDITAQRERTRDLIEQRDRLDEFAAVVSHDLRNPLEVAKIQLEAARDRGDAVHFEKVDDAHDRMERIVEDVLALARQGQVIDDVGAVALSMVAADAWAAVSAPEATMRVVDDAVVEADADRLRELLENLFRNAREHGGPDVTIRVGAFDDGFYVADDGPGIPADDRERVFEGGYSTSDDGTGLGLVIVERIAAAHGWEVSATESADGGARFEFSRVDVRA